VAATLLHPPRAANDTTSAPDEGAEALVRPAMRGDRSAMRALLVVLVPVVARAARRVLGRGHPDIDDVGQQALGALVQRLPSFRGESSVAHFAERIAVYKALSARRDAGARRRLVEAAAREGEGASAPPDTASEPSCRALLLEALDTLSPEQAEALTLHFLFDHTVPEIAAVAGVPAETVRSRLRLGKQALRARIQKDERLVALREGWE
jgi:RNA polymerase sigma-70 factor (ECF subfamily)